MGTPYTLALLSGDGFQVFGTLRRDLPTRDLAIEAAKEDYLRRFGGSPAFRVYHAEREGSTPRHSLIEVCFDGSKRRSFVALYKVIQESEPTPNPTPTGGGSMGSRSTLASAAVRIWRRLVARLDRRLPRIFEPAPTASCRGGC